MFIDSELGAYKVSCYCEEAKELTGQNLPCTECPFGDCLFSLKSSEKRLILDFKAVQEVYAHYDINHSISAATSSMGIAKHKINYWLTHRDKIEQTLKTYAPAL